MIKGAVLATIYIFTNILNGKTYIGKTERSFDVRLSQHLSAAKNGSDLLLHRAIRKYGIENFHIECLTVSDKLVNLWEKHLIKRWNSKAPNGYNMTDGGEGSKGLECSKETRKKMSKARKGKKHTKETKQKIAETKVGVKRGKFSKEWKDNLSKAGKGRKHSEETKNIIGKAQFGKLNHAAKAIILMHSDGTEEKFGCVNDACRKYNLHQGHLSAVSRGQQKQHKGYKAKYIN